MVNDTLVSGGIHFTGLGSGTDFDEMITKLVEIETTKKTRLEVWKTSWKDKITAFQELNSAMLDLSSTLRGMDSPSKFVVKTAASTNDSAISATAGAEALPATHSVVVTQLAQNNVIYSNATVADPASGDLTGGAAKVFSYTYDGQTVNLNVASGTTLQGLANLINNTSGNPGVRAEVLKISDGDYRLKMVGLDLGQDYGITVNAVTPGFIQTDMTSVLPEAVVSKMLESIPLGRLGAPEDIASAVSYLAGPGAGYVTGQVLAVNGGMYM